MKRDRYLGEARFGVFGGCASDLTPKRAYLILDGISLLKEGKLRIVTSEVVKLLADETEVDTKYRKATEEEVFNKPYKDEVAKMPQWLRF